MRKLNLEAIAEAFADMEGRLAEARENARSEALDFAHARGYGEAEAEALAEYIAENAPGILTKEEEDLYTALLTYSSEEPEEPEPKPEGEAPEEPAEDRLTGDPVVDGLCAETFPELVRGPDLDDIGTCE